MKGLFVTIEGPEGSGKTTLIQSLLPYFEQKEQKVMATREPVVLQFLRILERFCINKNIR